jgi:SAM-dependent methyltransferase
VDTWVGIAAFAALVVTIAALLNWEIYTYEGVHLGPRVQGWLYDRWAARYDLEKQAGQARDAEVLARPLVQALQQRFAQFAPEAARPLVLDVATGTARMPTALLGDPEFTGTVVGVDVSRGMLERAATKLAGYGDRLALVCHTAVPLPFPEASFDAACCMEALEVMPNMHEPLAELARVLQPGGILLTSRGGPGLGLVGKIRGPEEFESLLREVGFEQIQILPWQQGKYDFDCVWARKPGQATPSGRRALSDVLCCPACGVTALSCEPGRLRCRGCGATVPVDEHAIVLMT